MNYMPVFDDSQVGTAVVNTLKAWGFWSAIVAVIVIIILGYILVKRKVLKQEWDVVLIKVVMSIGLPCLAFKSFMTDINDVDTLLSQVAVLLAGFLFFIIMCIASRFFFIKYDQDVRDTLSMCMVFTITTFYALPVAQTVFGNTGTISANIFNVPYRIFLYTIGLMTIARPVGETDVNSKNINKVVATSAGATSTAALQVEAHGIAVKIAALKKFFKQVFMNLTLMATLVGLVFWALQLVPGIDVVPHQATVVSKLDYLSPLRLDNLFPPFMKIMTLLAGICTPLALLAIGISLTKGNIKEAMRNKTVWYSIALKNGLIPVIGLALGVVSAAIFAAAGHKMSSVGLTVTVLMVSTPPATMIVSFTIRYQKQQILASNVLLISTILSIITVPIWIIVATAVGASNEDLFHFIPSDQWNK